MNKSTVRELLEVYREYQVLAHSFVASLEVRKKLSAVLEDLDMIVKGTHIRYREGKNRIDLSHKGSDPCLSGFHPSPDQ